MRGPTIKPKRSAEAKRKRNEREKAERADDRRAIPLHKFGNVGRAIAEPDYKPRICGNPEETLAAAFIRMKRDYGGPLPADFVLRAVLQSGQQ